MGVFAKIHNDYFILTTSHVADFFQNNLSEDLQIRVNKKLFINVLGDIKYTDIDNSKGIDLAYIKIDKQMIEPLSKSYIPLEIDNIRSHHNLFHAMNYCFLEFPEKNITKENEPFVIIDKIFKANIENLFTFFTDKNTSRFVALVSYFCHADMITFMLNLVNEM